MFGLFQRLSALDADVASAVRVIGFFDALVEQGAGIDLVVRQTAVLAECPAGVRSADGRLSERAEPGGPTRSGGPPAGARRYQLPSRVDVWLERDGIVHPLDDLVLERFALATAAVLGHGQQDLDTLTKSELLQLAVTASVPALARRRALEHLGLRPAAVVHVVATTGPPSQLDGLGAHLAGRYHGRIGGLGVVLAAQLPADTLAVPPGCRAGIAAPCPATDLPLAWRQARTALRFTLPSTHLAPPYPPYQPPVVHFDRLGPFALAAETFTAEQISQQQDVITLDRLAEAPGGEEMLQCREAVAATDSLRRAAAVLHLHHNSLAHRVARAEQVLGYSISDLYARPRLMLAIVLRRIRDSAELG
jgi:PucR C-terminal helix-turn-helix domain